MNDNGWTIRSTEWQNKRHKDQLRDQNIAGEKTSWCNREQHVQEPQRDRKRTDGGLLPAVEGHRLEQNRTDAQTFPGLTHHNKDTTTTTATRSISVDPPWLSFSSQPCHPLLPASSLWGPRSLPPADRQMCEPVLLCFDSHRTKSQKQLKFVLLQQRPLNLLTIVYRHLPDP